MGALVSLVAVMILQIPRLSDRGPVEVREGFLSICFFWPIKAPAPLVTKSRRAIVRTETT